MPRKHQAKAKLRAYDAECVRKAVEAVQAKTHSLRHAAEVFGVPKSTIADRVSGRIEIDARPGRSPALPRAVEERIVKVATVAAQKGMGVSRRQLLLKTGRICRSLNLSTPFKNSIPGKDWFQGLQKRFPELTTRKPEKLGTARASMLNTVVVDKFFQDLKTVVTQLNLKEKPQHIWNCDETGKQLTHDPVRVVAKKGDKNVVGRTSNDRTNVTIMVCVNANGEKMPPMFVVKGKTKKSIQSYNVRAAPPNSQWAFQQRAWMDDELGEAWFRNVFLPNCGPERPQLLILDGHSSHETLSLLELAVEENIHILCLPPHTTHALQPLDRAVFGPFNKAFNRICSDYLSASPINQVSKWTFPYLFKLAWDEGITETNIKAGFSACGIYPLNKAAVPSQMYLPSLPTERPLPAPTSSPLPSTSQSSNILPPLPNMSDENIPSFSSSQSVASDTLSTSVKLPVASSTALGLSLHMPAYPVSISDDNTPISDMETPISPQLPVAMDLPVPSDVASEPVTVEPFQNAQCPPLPEDPQSLIELILSGKVEIIVDAQVSIASQVVVAPDPSINDLEDSVSSPFIPPNASKPVPEDNMVVDTPTPDSETLMSQESVVASDYWNMSIDSIFDPPCAPNQKPNIKKTKKTTCHRVLTSETVIREKREQEEKKARLEREKNERKIKREAKLKVKKIKKE